MSQRRAQAATFTTDCGLHSTDNMVKTATAATAAIILSGSIIMYQRQLILGAYRRCRGIEGMLRFIWIGDYLVSSFVILPSTFPLYNNFI